MTSEPQQQGKCYQCGKCQDADKFWFLHSPQDSNYEWNLCSLSCLGARVQELRDLSRLETKLLDSWSFVQSFVQ